jgi:hypothetical protein
MGLEFSWGMRMRVLGFSTAAEAATVGNPGGGNARHLGPAMHSMLPRTQSKVAERASEASSERAKRRTMAAMGRGGVRRAVELSGIESLPQDLTASVTAYALSQTPQEELRQLGAAMMDFMAP